MNAPRTKVENIRRVILNGRPVKLFDLRRRQDNAWVFQGTYSAPLRTPDSKLLAYAEAGLAHADSEVGDV
jgi:hypothetical protein